MNVGMDPGFYMWILVVTPTLIAMTGFVFMLSLVRDAYKKKNMKLLRRGVIASILMFMFVIFITWATFGAYGPGIQVDVTPAEDDGINILNDSAPEEKTIEEIKQEAEEDKNELLKQVQNHAWGKGEEDDFNKYVDEVLKVKDSRR